MAGKEWELDEGLIQGQLYVLREDLSLEEGTIRFDARRGVAVDFASDVSKHRGEGERRLPGRRSSRRQSETTGNELVGG